MKSYEGLYASIVRLVDDRIAQNIKSDGTLQTLTGVAVYSDRKLNEVANELSKIFATHAELTQLTGKLDDLSLALEYMVPEVIVNGLDVTATDPPSNQITISAGYGGKRGRPCRLDDEKTIDIPLDDYTSVYYVTLRSYGQINIRWSEVDNELTLAKIIVPKPGTTSAIQDDKDDTGYDGYIISAKDAYFDEDQVFDDASLAVLRNAIGDILADNIIGNIRLSENLKIINTHGTLELNSQEMLIKNLDGNKLAEFNKDGIYFFDQDGYERAHFSTDHAHIGNILITPDSIQSTNYISDNRGFKIQDTGYAEFEDVRIRGRISSSVFEYNKISAVGGKLFVGNSSVLSENVSTLDTTITVEDSIFSIGDILIIKDGINEEYMEVTNEDSEPTYTVTRNLKAILSTPSWEKGNSIISTGIGTIGSQTGFILLDAASNNSPFIDINLRNSTTYNDWTTKVRLGNLAGITDSDYGTLSGFGLYSDNVYLKGSLYSPTIKTAITGRRIELDDSGLFLYDASDAALFSVYITGADAGDVVIGNLAGNYTKWDDSASLLSIKGDITAESGDFTGTVNVGTAGKVYIDGVNEVIKVYDASSNLRVELGKLT